ncbi:MAG: hypothetical protein HFE66_03885 [Clostridiales bacterium]|nr:hypothetical protein [Clostridiales bacterium]
MDWTAIKTEYVTTDTSYRKLSAKYGVSSTQIANHAKSEKWVEEKERFLAKSYTKTLEALSDGYKERAKRILGLSDKILDKIEKALDIVEVTDIHAIRNITVVLKDLKEIQLFKDDGDGPSEMHITVGGWDPSWGQ